MNIDLKQIVPELDKRCEKLNKLRKVMMVLAFLIVPAVPAMIVMSRYGYCAMLCRVVNAVKMRDKMLISECFGYAPNALDAARKLIDTGNLSGYRIVADVMFVRDGVEVTEQEAIGSFAARFNPVAAVNAGMRAEDMSPAVRDAIARQTELQEKLAAEMAAKAAHPDAPASEDGVQPAAGAAVVCPHCGRGIALSGCVFCPFCGGKL